MRAKIRFEEFNLLGDFRDLGQFDIIFCRNVMIYFDLETKKAVLRRLSDVLAKDGFLIMGSAETVVGLSDTLISHPELRLASVHRPDPAPCRTAATLPANPPPARPLGVEGPGVLGFRSR